MPHRCAHAAGVQARSQSPVSVCPRGQVPCRQPEELDTRVPLCWPGQCCLSFGSGDASPQLSATLASPSADSRDYRAASAPLLCRRFPLQNPWDEGEEEAFWLACQDCVRETFWLSVFRDVDPGMSRGLRIGLVIQTAENFET